jgi:multisubunit Na+/H+ antiporter MnhB subunit
LNKIFWLLLSAGVSIILALTAVLKIPAWHQTIGGYVGVIFLVVAFIILAFVSARKVSKMELNLQFMKGKSSASIIDLRAIRAVLEKAGYRVEIKPTELSPQVFIIRK